MTVPGNVALWTPDHRPRNGSFVAGSSPQNISRFGAGDNDTTMSIISVICDAPRSFLVSSKVDHTIYLCPYTRTILAGDDDRNSTMDRTSRRSHICSHLILLLGV